MTLGDKGGGPRSSSIDFSSNATGTVDTAGLNEYAHYTLLALLSQALSTLSLALCDSAVNSIEETPS